MSAGTDELYPATLDCVHCGLCLSSCPTYRETGRETSSPRGRVYLMRGLAEGRIPLGDTILEESQLCLGCRACETACPSGVRYGALLERTRAVVEEAGLRDGWPRRLERFALTRIVPHRGRLAALVSGLRLAQLLRLDRLALGVLPERLREMHALLPKIPARSERERLPAELSALGRRRGRVALFEGCIMPELFGAVNAATARVLQANGFDVVVPRDQGCCGALQAHSGDLGFAHGLARRNLEAFDPGDVDAVILNSAGCGAAMRECGDWLPGEGAPLAGAVRDVCEFLDEAGLTAPLRELPLRVCYDDPCHLVHAQGVAAAPRRVLEAIPGLTLVTHADPGACCGAAGTYNITQPEMSRAVLAHKIEALAAADPDVIATGNPGCLMQIEQGVRAAGLRAEVLHPVTLLDRAIETRAR